MVDTFVFGGVTRVNPIFVPHHTAAAFKDEEWMPKSDMKLVVAITLLSSISEKNKDPPWFPGFLPTLRQFVLFRGTKMATLASRKLLRNCRV